MNKDVGLEGRIKYFRRLMVKKEEAWAEAKKRHHLSVETVRMAQELGLNPKKLGKIANHKQEPWKTPLSIFIKNLYEKQQSKQKAKVKVAV